MNDHIYYLHIFLNCCVRENLLEISFIDISTNGRLWCWMFEHLKRVQCCFSGVFFINPLQNKIQKINKIKMKNNIKMSKITYLSRYSIKSRDKCYPSESKSYLLRIFMSICVTTD